MYCYICGIEIDEDCLCYGCGAYVCMGCDSGLNSPMGPHHPDAHLDADEDDEYDDDEEFGFWADREPL